MNEFFQSVVLKSTGSDSLFEIEGIQSLWSGYGEIVRYGLVGGLVDRVVVKHVRFPNQGNHPRGWNTDLSHERKVRSYEVETAWYDRWSLKCGDHCHVPHCYAMESQGDEVLIVLEDLDASGFDLRKSSVSWGDVEACLVWLANFHATFLGEIPEGLWKTGTYWHLDTRPEELDVLDDHMLKSAALRLDEALKESPYQTFVHGDAKLANFCFSGSNQSVSAVDFQYVGGGCGMKDVAYFVGSCYGERECERLEVKILDFYFMEFRNAISRLGKDVDVDALEENWRSLYHFAWTDFHRFLKGWSPGHWKINSYSERVARDVVSTLRTDY